MPTHTFIQCSFLLQFYLLIIFSDPDEREHISMYFVHISIYYVIWPKKNKNLSTVESDQNPDWKLPVSVTY